MSANSIKTILFPDTVEEGFAIVTGSRAEEYLGVYPQATETEALDYARKQMTSAATPIKVDALVDGEERRLNIIAALPTDEQIASGNHALELTFLDDGTGTGQRVEFDDPQINGWLKACSEELFEAVYAYFQQHSSLAE